MEKNITYNLNKNILFDKLNYGENLLILHDNTNNHKQIFRNFMQQMDNNSILLYVSHKTNLLNLSFDIRNISFNIVNENFLSKLKNQLDKHLKEIEKKNRNILLIIDWSKANLNDKSILLPFLEDLINRSKYLTPPLWKRKYKGIRKKTHLNIINAFEVKDLKGDFIQQLISLHQRIFLLQEKSNSLLLSNISPSLDTIFPKFHVLPQDILTKLVKDNLEFLTLIFLEKAPRSGYQILKEIANHFHCILSQGTLYPLLYQLEKEGKIIKQDGKGREIIYSLNQKTKNELQSKKETMLRAYQHLASFFGGGGDGKKITNLEKQK